jgi:hypothetical protein
MSIGFVQHRLAPLYAFNQIFYGTFYLEKGATKAVGNILQSDWYTLKYVQDIILKMI